MDCIVYGVAELDTTEWLSLTSLTPSLLGADWFWCGNEGRDNPVPGPLWDEGK